MDISNHTLYDPLRLLSFSDLVSFGLFNNRTTLKRHVVAGTFPAPIQLSGNRLAWRASEVLEFLDKRSEEREKLVRRWRGE